MLLLNAFRKFPLLSVVSFISTAAMVTGCGLGSERRRVDKIQVNHAVDHLRSGGLVRAMNEDRARSARGMRPLENAAPESAPTPSASPSSSPQGADPCPGVANPAPTMTEVERLAAAKDLGACFRTLTESARMSMGAISFFEAYQPLPSAPLSWMSAAELAQTLRTDFQDPSSLYATSSPLLARIRNRYSDEDLQELTRLIARRQDAFQELAARVYSAMENRPALIQSMLGVNRWAALQAMKDHREDPTGLAQATAVQLALGSAIPSPRRLANYPVILFQPYALMALIPGPGREVQPLDPDQENPFRVVLPLLSQLGGSAQRIQGILTTYRELREKDNAPMPEHPPASSDAVRVAFFDTGIDFQQYSELGLFAGQGMAGAISQGDYADLDSNPWSPALGALAHGSGTLGTLLTLISQQAPELLRDRRIEVAMWKTFSLRSILAGPPYSDLSSVDPRNPTAFSDGLIARIDGEGVKPKIVSVSLGGETETFIQKAHKSDVLLRAPWLWVMAAGNEGQDVHARHTSCFDDIGAERRLDARILCVGALKRMDGPTASPRIAEYSNFGNRVDLYAFETYDERCPNGTSCSTPAISAAAAILAAKYPESTVEQIKIILVESSEIQTLEVDSRNPSVPRVSREVRVFDPVTMMPVALARAERTFHPTPATTPSPRPSTQLPTPVPTPSPSAGEGGFVGQLIDLGRGVVVGH